MESVIFLHRLVVPFSDALLCILLCSTAQDTPAAAMLYRREFEKNAIQKMVNIYSFWFK